MSERPQHSPEPLDDDGIRITKLLIQEALKDDLPEIKQLRSIQAYLQLDSADRKLLYERGIDVGVNPLIQEIEDEITREFTDRVNEINSSLSNAPGFTVEVQIEGVPFKVGSVVRQEDRIVPMIDDEIRHEPIESVSIHD
jgi:hypothetical protein